MFEFARFRTAKNKASINAVLYFYFILPNTLGTNFDRKGSEIFLIMQKNGKLSPFIGLVDGASRL